LIEENKTNKLKKNDKDDLQKKAEELYNEYFEWGRKHGATVNKVGVEAVSDNNRKIVAKEDIKNGEYIFRVPLKIMITNVNPIVKEFCDSFHSTSLTDNDCKHLFIIYDIH
jgi:hypothetical protein